MMKIRTIIVAIVTLVLSLFLLSCEQMPSEKDSEMYKMYMLAKEAGYDNTYEKWLETLKEECSCKDGLSAYELYIKYNPFYKRSEEEWVNDLAEGKLKGKFALQNLSEVLTCEERFPYMVNGTVCLIDNNFIIIEDESCKILVKHKNYNGNKGDEITVTGTLIKEEDILVFDSDSIVDLKIAYTSEVAYNPILDQFSNDNITSVKYVNVQGKLNTGSRCVELLNNKFNIINYSKEYESLNGKPVDVLGYVFGSKIYIIDIEEIKISSINVNIEKTVFVGYKLKATAEVYPSSATQDVIWEVDKNSLATINENGMLTALSVGKIKVRATYAYDANIHSEWVEVEILKEPDPWPCLSGLRGYEIIIMTDDAKNSDPFYNKEIDGVKYEYTNPDKTYKQKAWREVETKYDCKIIVREYPDNAMWGDKRIKWIIDNAEKNASQFDLGLITTEWIPQLYSENVAIDTSELYEKYGMNQMLPFLKAAGTYDGKLLVASPSLDLTKVYVSSGLFYNYGWVKELKVEDPAKMFNDGKWTYSEFKKWVIEVQLKLGENEFVLQGDPYCYWLGMSNAMGIKVCDSTNYSANIDDAKQVEASNLISELMNLGCVIKDETNASFKNRKSLMTTGDLQSLKDKDMLSSIMWGEGKIEYGYVPFPYPDNLSKEDTRISISSCDAYFYVTGRIYPEEIEEHAFSSIWYVMNEMFYKTSFYEKEDSQFDYEKDMTNYLSEKLDNYESIKAIKYYDGEKVLFDPTNAIYKSLTDNPLKTATYSVLYEGKEYYGEFNKAKELFELKIKQFYRVNIL